MNTERYLKHHEKPYKHKRWRMNMEPQIYDFQSKNIIGVGNIGTPVSPVDVWPVLFSRIDKVLNRKHSVETLGIIKRNEHGYLAGVEVWSDYRYPKRNVLL